MKLVSATTPSTQILVLGDSRRRALTMKLLSLVDAWCKRWSVLPTPVFTLDLVRVNTDTVRASKLSALRGVVMEESGTPQLYVVVADDLLSRLLGLQQLAALDAADHGSVAFGVAQELVHSLAEAMVQSIPRSTARVAPLVAGIMQDQIRHWWTATLRYGSQQESIAFVMSPQLVAVLAPSPTRVTEGEMTRRKHAIAEDPIRLEVVLGEVQLTVGELASLNVNDVIVLAETLTQPAMLVTLQNERVAGVSVGKAGDSRAVRIR